VNARGRGIGGFSSHAAQGTLAVSGHVFCVERKRGAQWYCKYRVGGKQVQKRLVCSNLGLERGSTYADGAEAVLEGWREAGLVADGAQTMPEERQQEPVDKLERFRVEKLERIGPFAADDLERITLDRFERGTVDDGGADVSLGDTETQGSPASGTKDDD
jgi:hypothetical protein